MFMLRSAILRQYVIIITANLSFICVGFDAGWPSPVIIKLKNENQTIVSRPLTDEEISWLPSIPALSGFLFNFVIGFLMDRFGRKTCIIMGFAPRLIFCFMVMFGKEVWLLLLGRAIDGIGNVCAMAVVSIYASEIASKECRGALGTISQVASALGMLFFFGIGPFLPYFELHVTLTIIVALISIPMWFIPETPYYLYSKGRKEESLKILTYLRGSEELALEEYKLYSLNQPSMSKREVFRDRTTRRTTYKVIFLSALLELMGYNAVLSYMQPVLEAAHTSVREDIASLINGCIQLIACFCTILLTDRWGRKPILATTLLGMAVGMIGFGAFFQVKLSGAPISGFLNYLPVLSMMLIMFCFNAGMGSIFWILVAELFDGPARAVGSALGVCVANFIVFLTIKFFSSIVSAIGEANIFWIFSCICIITAIFVLFLVPETKGKTFAEIQQELGRNIFKTDSK